MATYYVRTDGNDANTGLGSSAGQAWQTLSKALGATGIGSGDTLYIAPGTYRQGTSIIVGGTYSAMTYVYGDPTGAQFSGVPAGVVRITTFTPSDTSASTSVNAISITSKSNLTFANLFIEVGSGLGIVCATSCDNIFIQDCVFSIQGRTAGTSVGVVVNTGQVSTGITVQRCQFFGGHTSIAFISQTTSGQDFKCFAYDNICDAFSGFGICVAEPTNTTIQKNGIGTVISNNIIIGGTTGFITAAVNTSAVTVRNNIVINASTNGMNSTWSGSAIVASNNLLLQCANNFSGMSSTGGRTAGVYGFDIGEQFKFGLATLMRYTNWLASPNIAAGSTSNAPTNDQYNVTWYSTTPDIGAVTYRNVQNILPTYAPTERNASAITIAPGSTSQSIELYLGAVGLTASSSGLSARYNRSRTASVNIPLVARTIGQAWTSGGFAEVDAVNMPGIYRVDIPDAALAAGADDVTLVVRGASGTNGAVMTIKLSSGGLTSAQTASAVWGASVAGYNTATDFGGVVNEIRNVVGSTEQYVLDVPNQVWEELTENHDTHGTYGWNVLRADAPSKEGLVTLHQSGGVSRVDADIHAIANDTDAALELKGALLHNGTDYISADLLSPNVPTSNLRMGPYKVVADQDKQEINVDILTGASLPVVLQLVDAMGTGIPLSGATLSVKVYNTSGTLINTYPGTASYSDAGFVTFTLDTVVTASPGTYYVTVTRTTGASDTSIYGGLRLYVRSN